MFYIIFFFFSVSAKVFLWKPNNNLRTVSNWAKQVPPCYNDRIHFNADSEVVAFFDEDVEASKILFPDSGEIFFGNNIQVGKKAKICQRENDDADEVYFDGPGGFSSVYDAESWFNFDSSHEILHMNRIPSQKDSIMIQDDVAVQMSIEDTLDVQSFSMGGRKFTSESFERLLSTVEGEFQIKLGHQIGKERDVGDVQMQVATGKVLNIVGKQDETFGVMNRNGKKEKMYLLCQYFKSEGPHEGKCLNPIRPFGHCKAVCGATLDFGAHEVKFADMKSVIDEFWREFEFVREDVSVTLERTNEDDYGRSYQISILPKKNITKFDDDEYAIMASVMEKKLKGSAINSIAFFDIKLRISTKDHSYTTASKIVGSTVFCVCLVLLLVYTLFKNKDRRREVFSHLLSASSLPNFAVRFSAKSKTGTDDVVELIDSAQIAGDTIGGQYTLFSEEEDMVDTEMEPVRLVVPIDKFEIRSKKEENEYNFENPMVTFEIGQSENNQEEGHELTLLDL